jgi:hypothetical protein
MFSRDGAGVCDLRAKRITVLNRSSDMLGRKRSSSKAIVLGELLWHLYAAMARLAIPTLFPATLGTREILIRLRKMTRNCFPQMKTPTARLRRDPSRRDGRDVCDVCDEYF